MARGRRQSGTAGRPSTIATHPNRAEIEAMISRGVSLRNISQRFGVSMHAVHRYKHNHMPPKLKAAMAAKFWKPEADLAKLRAEESENFLLNLARQRAVLLHAQDCALENTDFSIVAMLSAQIHKSLELSGKYLALFAQHVVKTSVSLVLTPEYLQLRAAIMTALREHPAARAAVAAELHKIEAIKPDTPQRPAIEHEHQSQSTSAAA